MIRERADVVILGAGFAGSLMALVLRQIGRNCILVEKGTHPRFAIGESSTPVANLALEEISKGYDLPRLWPLSEWGRWQRAYPHLACGLKRGFTYVRHEAGQAFASRPDHANELLVAASPSDEVADTHWFREHFDHFVLQEAVAAGIPYYDQTNVKWLQRDDTWTIHGRQGAEEVEFRAQFVIDATGPAGVLCRELGIDTSPAGLLTNAWTVFNHFTDVGTWEETYRAAGGDPGPHPYRCDHAALHHVLDDGWMWVLRFNNGITSAGFALDGERCSLDATIPAEAEFERYLQRYPSVRCSFERARPVQPWVRTGRMQRRARRVAGDGWALLAHAAYFLDPLFSSGNAHTLLTIERLAGILGQHWGRPTLRAQLVRYEEKLLREVAFVDRLVHGCYRSFRTFELFTAFVMYYFAGAIQAETRRRQGMAGPDDEFLFSHHPPFREAVFRAHEAVVEMTTGRAIRAGEVEDFARQVGRDIAEYNPAGLCDPGKCNMYPFV
jgi:FADH2 O2-dependent halogenase